MARSSRLRAWLEERGGVPASLDRLLADLRRPEVSRLHWAYTLGAAALFLFVLQVVSGVLLLLYYRPSASEAHSSIVFLLSEVPGGWFLRSLHVQGANAMVAAVLIHALRVYLTAGYKRPRELTWVLGCVLLALVLGLTFTGSVLPWHQRAYWATTIGTEMAGGVPGAGAAIVRLLRGGTSVTDLTLGRFFAMHVVVLPAILLAVAGVHLWLVRRLGIAPAAGVDEERRLGHAAVVRGADPYWPHQALREAVVLALVLAAVVTLAVLHPEPAGEPANPLVTPEGVRPEWYFLPLYQLQKYLPSRLGPLDGKTLGFGLQAVAGLVLVLLPFLDRSPHRRASQRPRAVAAGVMAAAGVVLLGMLGAVAGRTLETAAGPVRFDVYGMPSWGSQGFATGEGPLPAGEVTTSGDRLAGLDRRAAPPPSSEAPEETCTGCHTGAAKDLGAGEHAGRGVPCTACHQGDPTSFDASAAHEGLLFPDESAIACEKCHVAQAEAFRRGPHGAALQEGHFERACARCHGFHDVKDPGDEGLKELCVECHQDDAGVLAAAAGASRALAGAGKALERFEALVLESVPAGLEAPAAKERLEVARASRRDRHARQHAMALDGIRLEATEAQKDLDEAAGLLEARLRAYQTRGRVLPWVWGPLVLLVLLLLFRLDHFLRGRAPAATRPGVKGR